MSMRDSVCVASDLVGDATAVDRSVVRDRPASVNLARTERGDSLLEVLIAVAVVATTALGAIAAQCYLLQADRALQARMRATLIADAALEFMRAGRGETVALAAARRDALRELDDGIVTVLPGNGGASVLLVGWSEPHAAFDGGRSQDCPARSAMRAGHVARCVSVGYVP